MNFKNSLLIALALVGTSTTLLANLRVTEAHSSGSGNSTYQADWFEITNIGASTIDLTGWKVDDASQSFVSGRPLRGVTSIAPGKSVVFMESNADGSNDAAKGAAFKAAWFGSNIPADFQLGYYGGSGIGLSTDGDQVNIYTSTGILTASIAFQTATTGRTFDNAALIDGVETMFVSQLSVDGVNGAFMSVTGGEIGSPGAIPEPSTYALLAGAAAMGLAMFRRTRARALTA
ncbi:MAG: lamin tail domain-containing protein [Opitutaceae bacterium]|nr:lamin tail domain-containing protein [Opitutaceae bacterium]